jgi:hypothetical protein
VHKEDKGQEENIEKLKNYLTELQRPQFLGGLPMTQEP